MPVTNIFGNALDFPENTNVLIHCVSLKPVMGAGVARQITEEYPAAFEAHRDYIATGNAMLGQFSSVVVAGGTKRICNLIAQADIGTERRQLDYEALYTGLSTFRDILQDAAKHGRVYRVAMPWLGCGLAGGSKRVVAAMIDDIFGDSPIEVFVVEYIPKTSAKPVEIDVSAAPVAPADSSQIS